MGCVMCSVEEGVELCGYFPDVVTYPDEGVKDDGGVLSGVEEFNDIGDKARMLEVDSEV